MTSNAQTVYVYSLFLQHLFTQEGYDKPFFTTYFKTSLLSIYLIAFIFWRPWHRLCCFYNVKNRFKFRKRAVLDADSMNRSYDKMKNKKECVQSEHVTSGEDDERRKLLSDACGQNSGEWRCVENRGKVLCVEEVSRIETEEEGKVGDESCVSREGVVVEGVCALKGQGSSGCGEGGAGAVGDGVCVLEGTNKEQDRIQFVQGELFVNLINEIFH